MSIRLMDKDPARYLFSSIRPSLAERAIVLDEIATLQIDRNSVNEALAHSENLLFSLKQEKRLVRIEKELRREYLSPIRLVPYELLGRIFELYLQLNPDHIGRLQLVSRTWNAAATGHRKLWTRLDVTGPFHAGNIPLHHLHIRTYVHRSGLLPLKVTFDARAPYASGCQLRVAHSILEFLSTFASARWASFTLVGGQANSVRGGYMAAIHVARIVERAVCMRSLFLEGSVVLAQQPLLGGILAIPSPQILALPDALSALGSIRILTLPNVPWLKALSPMATVEDLTILFDARWDSDWFRDEKKPWLTTFPSLRVLTVSVDKAVAGGDIWHRSDLPKRYNASRLRKLTIEGPVPSGIFYPIEFSALVELRIQANYYAGYVCYYPDDWRTAGAENVQRLTLSCARCSSFWPLAMDRIDYEKVEDVKSAAIHANQLQVLDLFGSFPNLQDVMARSCVWRQLSRIFGEWSEAINNAAMGPCDDFRIINMDDIRVLLDARH